jgi:hypothetical protein
VHRALSILNSVRFDAPLPCERAISQVRLETGLDFSRARARAGFARGHLLDIVVYLPGGNGNSFETDAAESLVELLVGEELFERWIGNVVATPTVRGGLLAVINETAEDRAALPIATLLDSVRAAIAGLKLGLAQAAFAHSADSADWFAFELSPDTAADYAAQDDLLFCSTRVPEPKKCFLHGERFFSGRFTASSALFTYLKYDTSETGLEARLAERSKYEQLIQRVVPEREGTVVGIGLGVRYGYIDLLLADPDCARQSVLPALRALGISEQSWVLFCDTELNSEFLPVYPGSPPPFGA